MSLSLNLGTDLSSALERFSPSRIEGLTGEWDLSDISSITFQSGSGVGGIIGNIANLVNPGTLDLASSSIVLSGSFGEEPTLLFDMSGRLSASNLDDNTMDLFSDVVISQPYTIFQAGRVYPDDFDNSSTAQKFGGMNSNASLQVGTDDDLDYVRNEANMTVQVSTGFDKSEDLHIRVMNVSSTSSGTMTHYDSSSQVGTSGDFDPESTNGVDNNFIRPLGISTGAGAQSLRYMLYYNRALTSAEESQVIAFIRGRFGVVTTQKAFLGMLQSNMVGDANLGTATRFPYEDRMKVFPNDQVLAAYSHLVAIDKIAGSVLTVLDDTTPQYSMGASFMNTWSRSRAEQPVFAIAAKGGISVEAWLASRNASDPDDTTTLYGAALTQYLRLRDTENIDVAGIILQGLETDAANSRTEAQMDSDLSDLIDFIRLDTGDNVQFSLGAPTDALPIGSFPTRDAAILAVQNFSKAGVFIADTSDSTIFTVKADNIHFDVAGMDLVGALHAANFI